jgi:CO/xanthine dehydrogenase Mo-binding subunit
MPVVGKSVPRKDAWDKVQGKARYIDDYSFSDILYATTVRSPYAYAKLNGIETAEAAKMPGVKAVITHADVPGKNAVPLVFEDEPFLAQDYLRFHGEPVALVVADSYEEALAAAEKVKISAEPLKPVLSITKKIIVSVAIP